MNTANENLRALNTPVVLMLNGRHEGRIWGRSYSNPPAYDVKTAERVFHNITEEFLYDAS